MSICPFCKEDIGKPFENVRDAEEYDPGEDDFVKVWTLHHACNTRHGPSIWVEGYTENECAARWDEHSHPIGIGK